MLKTSALCAILLNEPEREQYLESIDKATKPFTVATVLAEAALGVAERKRITHVAAIAMIEVFLKDMGIPVVPFIDKMAVLAMQARDDFGKGKHPAKLNFGGCLSYTAARYYRAPLLFKGDDCSQTNINRKVRKAI